MKENPSTCNNKSNQQEIHAYITLRGNYFQLRRVKVKKFSDIQGFQKVTFCETFFRKFLENCSTKIREENA